MPNALSKPIHRCPVAAFQKMISGKYKLRILWDLQDGPRRYGEIRSGLLRGADGSPPIAPRVLSRELKAPSTLRHPRPAVKPAQRLDARLS